MARYAVIDNALVENVIVADSAPVISGRTVVALTAGQRVSPGDSYSGGAFTPRVPSARELAVAQAPENLRQLYAIARQRANALRTQADGLTVVMTVAQQQTLLRWVAALYDYAADDLLDRGRDQ